MQTELAKEEIAARIADACHLANRALIVFSERAGAPFPVWTQFKYGQFLVGVDQDELRIRCPMMLYRDTQAMMSIVMDTFNVMVLGGDGTDAAARDLVKVVFSTAKEP
jgi:hypothetical protein